MESVKFHYYIHILFSTYFFFELNVDAGSIVGVKIIAKFSTDILLRFSLRDTVYKNCMKNDSVFIVSGGKSKHAKRMALTKLSPTSKLRSSVSCIEVGITGSGSSRKKYLITFATSITWCDLPRATPASRLIC